MGSGTRHHPAATKPDSGQGLAEQLYEALKAKILMWELVPGDFLVEARLAAEYGVSRTPVRTCLSLLVRDGLVDAFPRVGYRVTAISLRDVHEIFDMRMLLEGEAAALAASFATDAELEDLGRTHRAWADVLAGPDTSKREYLRFHDEFHLGIAELSRSRRLAESIERLLFESTRLRMSDPMMSRHGLEGEQEDSRVLLDALLAHDPGRARTTLRMHIADSKERSLASLVERGSMGGLTVERTESIASKGAL